MHRPRTTDTFFQVTVGLALLGLTSVRLLWAQDFGRIKKKVTLQRKLPAIAHLTGTRISVKAGAEDSKNNDVAGTLRDMLETELLKNNRHLSVDDVHPDILITCTITSLTTPAPQAVTRKVASEKGLTDEQFLEISASMRVAYQARDARSQQVVDSYNLPVDYHHEVEGQGGGNVGTKTFHDVKKQVGKINGVIRRKKAERNEEPQTAQTPAELQQLLVDRAVKEIASRLVDTSETVEVLLARGKLDDVNKMADEGLWSRMAETLETMPPLPKPEDDAYRLYNLGVAYEALAYQAKAPKAAKKYLEQAAINYGKAIDDNPEEKYFLEPQRRIETAAAHYKVIEEHEAAGQTPPTAPAPPAASAGPAPASQSPASRPSRPTTYQPASTRPPSASSTAASAKALTNQDVIDLAQAGIGDGNLIADIRDAKAVHFDLTTAGQINLAHHGVKGRVLAAMRERAQRRSH